MARVVKVNGDVVPSLKVAMEITGLKFTAKQVAAGAISGVEFVEVADEGVTQEMVDKAIEEAGKLPSLEPSDTEEVVEDDTAPTPEGTATAADDGIEYPEKGSFKDEKAIKKYIKKLSDQQLYDWCELEGVTWKHNENAPINRMRAAMAIKAFHFPALAPKGDTKPKSKYSQYSDEELIAMAAEKGIAVKDAKGDKRINRMYHIIALREAGVLA